jgi:hypothetical protein
MNVLLELDTRSFIIPQSKFYGVSHKSKDCKKVVSVARRYDRSTVRTSKVELS